MKSIRTLVGEKHRCGYAMMVLVEQLDDSRSGYVVEPNVRDLAALFLGVMSRG